MTRIVATFAVSAILLIAGWYGSHRYAEYRLRTAFAEAGLSEDAAACMGRRLVRHLSLAQIYKLTALQHGDRSPEGLVRAAGEIDDPRVVKVAGTSLLLCSTGLSR